MNLLRWIWFGQISGPLGQLWWVERLGIVGLMGLQIWFQLKILRMLWSTKERQATAHKKELDKKDEHVTALQNEIARLHETYGQKQLEQERSAGAQRDALRKEYALTILDIHEMLKQFYVAILRRPLPLRGKHDDPDPEVSDELEQDDRSSGWRDPAG